MKIKLLILILFLNINCVHYNIHDQFNYKLTSVETEKLSSKKIGLLGFENMVRIYNGNLSYNQDLNSLKEKIFDEDYLKIVKFVNQNGKKILDEDYDFFKVIARTRRSRTSLIDKVLKEKTNEFLDFKKSEIKFDSKNKNNYIKDEDLRNFLSEYLGFYKHLGLKSAKEILLIDKTGEISLKNSDANYWLIGNHFIINENDHYSFPKSLSVTLIPFVLTYGLFPLTEEVEVKSNFFLYDANLKLLKKYSISKTYTKLVSWFFFWSKFSKIDLGYENVQNKHLLYEPTVKEFSKLLAEDLK